jgi:hypothetical protein
MHCCCLKFSKLTVPFVLFLPKHFTPVLTSFANHNFSLFRITTEVLNLKTSKRYLTKMLESYKLILEKFIIS